MGYDCSCDYDPVELYTASKVRARKTYKCEECAGEIRPGEQYEYVFGKWEGYVSTFKTCQYCHDIRQWVKNNVPCLCWSHGNTIEDCKEAVWEAHLRAPEETKGLRFGLLKRIAIRDKFNDERRKAKAA